MSEQGTTDPTPTDTSHAANGNVANTPPVPDGNTGAGGEQGGNKLFAGKYDTPEQLLQGYNEARKAVGLDPLDGNIYGKGGVFADLPAVERGYKDLQKLISTRQPQQQQQTHTPPANDNGDLSIQKPQQQAGGASGGDDATIDQVLEKANLKADELAGQWQQAGKLTDEQYQALQQAGYPKTVVDAYMQGQAAQAQLYQQQIQTAQEKAAQIAGGQQQHDNLRQFAADNLAGKDAIFDTLNQRVEQGDPAVYPDLIQYVAAKHREAVGAGKTQPLNQGGSAPAPTSLGAQSLAEFGELKRKAAAGDENARQRILNTDFNKFQ